MALTDNDLPKLVELLNKIDIRMQQRGKTAGQWAASNNILKSREMGVETDTGRWKLGDGLTAWNSLEYALSGRMPADASFVNRQTLLYDDISGLFEPGWAGDADSVDLTAAATVTIDASLSSTFRLVLDQDVSLATPTGLHDGQRITLIVWQNSAAGHALGFSAAYRFADNVVPTVNQTSLGVSIVSATYDAQADLLFAEISPNFTRNIGAGDWYKYEWSTAGSFTLNAVTATQLIVVGGGGGGNSYGGGGGGGGGVIALTRNLSAATYAVTVGAGGPGVASAAPSDGSDSSIDTFIRATGGKGGLHAGGGAAGGDSGAGYVDGIVVNQAYQGLDYNPGGGAGAGMDSPSNGNGGDGLAVSSIATYFGGGGGNGHGKPGGLGGGGAGSYAGTPTPGTDGLGGGGGGKWNTAGGGADGGRGAVIVLVQSQLPSYTGTVTQSIVTVA